MQHRSYLAVLAVLCLALPTISAAQSYPATSGAVGITDAACPNWEATKTSTSGRTISSPGIVSYEEITGQININSAGVTLHCVKINANGGLYGINCTTAAQCDGTIVEDSEIYNCDSSCLLTKSPNEAGRATFRRLYLHTTVNDLAKLGSYTTLQDTFFLNNYNPDPGAHNDAIQMVDGVGVIIERNNIQGPYQEQTSAVIAKTDIGPIDGLIIRNNRLLGGSYSLYLRDGGSGAPTNSIVTGNVWENNSWKFGPVSSDVTSGDCLVWLNNTTSTGGAVSPGAPVSCSCP